MMATYDQHGQQAQVQYNVAGNLHQQPRPVLLALHQLPPAISDFTGRTAEIARLIDLLTAPTSSSLTSVTILAVSGMGGVGKSALVIYVANQLADRFPDSQLYLNLRGGEGTPLDPSEALASLLGTLGVAADVLPRDLDGRTALYRSLLADKRVLVLLDNAHDTVQVQSLLPNNPRCAVLITSRSRMGTLPGAAMLQLNVLTEPDALALLTRLAGEARLESEPEAATQILEQCGRLPLAVRIVGAHLRAHPKRTLAAEGAAMAQERSRLEHLHQDDLDVRAAIQLSYRHVSSADQRLFLLLGLLPAQTSV